jgi:hypothetical protein
VAESFGEVIERDENLVVTSVLHPEAGQFVGPGVKVKLYDEAMAQEGTPTTKEWLDTEIIVLSETELEERKRAWANRVCGLRRHASHHETAA